MPMRSFRLNLDDTAHAIGQRSVIITRLRVRLTHLLPATGPVNCQERQPCAARRPVAGPPPVAASHRATTQGPFHRRVLGNENVTWATFWGEGFPSIPMARASHTGATPSMHGADTGSQSPNANIVSGLLSEPCAIPVRAPPDQHQTAPRPIPEPHQCLPRPSRELPRITSYRR
jgi:hypothetical protein